MKFRTLFRKKVIIVGNKMNVLKEYDKDKKVYERFAEDVENLLIKFLENNNITYNAITHRLKSRESLSNKIDVKNDKYEALSNITDIAGVRVISYYADDVDKIAEIVENEFAVDEKNSIDKRKALEPDRFGYCSVHYVVEMKKERLRLQEYKAYKNLKCEIQIRSVLQHAWAEIEHDLGYKSEITIPRDIRRNFSRLAGLLELADKEFQEIRSNLTTYKKDVQDKIKEEEFLDTEIDAVLLEVLIKSNSDIAFINEKVSGFFGDDFYDDISDTQFESTITELKWLGINTHSQLKMLISNYKKYAVKIAEHTICNSEKSYSSGKIHKTIAFFYLSYALLLNQHRNEIEVKNYLEYNNIGSSNKTIDDIVKELISIGDKVYLEDTTMSYEYDFSNDNNMKKTVPIS